MARRRSLADPRGLTSDEFLALLPGVRWFRRLGRPHRRDAEVKRLHSWDEWTGPECEEQDEHNERYLEWYDAIFRQARRGRVAVAPLYQSTFRLVRDRAAEAVAYDKREDTWHGPNCAVWSAAHRAALIVAGLHAGWGLADELVYAWRWYVAGHWPMWYARVPKPGRPPVYLVL